MSFREKVVRATVQAQMDSAYGHMPAYLLLGRRDERELEDWVNANLQEALVHDTRLVTGERRFCGLEVVTVNRGTFFLVT